MRLLKKNEIAQAQNSDKVKEIQEGLKITKYVDGLRELKVKEEEAIQKTRTELLSNLQAEIDELERKRKAAEDNLKAIDKTLTEKLSKTEQKALDDLRNSLEIEKISLIERANELDLKEIDLAISMKENEDTLRRRKSQEEESKRLHREANEREQKAQEALTVAKAIQLNAEKLKKELETSLNLREIQISEKEREIEEIKEQNLLKQRDLEAEKIQLADQRATLQRALERIKKNRL